MKSGDVTLGIEESDVDAVILDLAVPWLVVPHAYEALRPSGILVSFSPTIDQVVKTTEALRENGFVFIETIECMMRAMQVERGKTRPQTLMTGHTGYITHARKILKLPSQPTPEATTEHRNREASGNRRKTRNSKRKLLNLTYFCYSLLVQAEACLDAQNACFNCFAACQAIVEACDSTEVWNGDLVNCFVEDWVAKRLSRNVGFQILMLYSQHLMKKSQRAFDSESSSAPFLFINTQFSNGQRTRARKTRCNLLVYPSVQASAVCLLLFRLEDQ